MEVKMKEIELDISPSAACESRPEIEILVNEKPVLVPRHRLTGLEIKRAAIEQEVPIHFEAVLNLEHEHGRIRIVGDEEEIFVNRHDSFLAVSEIEVHMNEKPVIFMGHRQTGLQIKEAAIAEGVAIESDFVLSIELGHGCTKLVGDHEEISISSHSRFVAIPDDDNS
jgi:hypothetical protein